MVSRPVCYDELITRIWHAHLRVLETKLRGRVKRMVECFGPSMEALIKQASGSPRRVRSWRSALQSRLSENRQSAKAVWQRVPCLHGVGAYYVICLTCDLDVVRFSSFLNVCINDINIQCKLYRFKDERHTKTFRQSLT